MKDPYVQCYLTGRHDPFEGEVDIEKLAERVSAGSPLRDVALEVAKKEILKDSDATMKMQWIKDNLEDIREMGGDTERAFRLYCLGRTDQLASDLEEEVIGALDEGVGDDEDEGDEDEGDEDEGDEDEGDEDDED